MSKRLHPTAHLRAGYHVTSLAAAQEPALIDFSANVMAPLHIEGEDEWQVFERNLNIAKTSGVDAVSVDVWWGQVEPEEKQYNFAYYDRIFTVIKRQGLKIIPIFSFHQCGGDVGDTYCVQLPEWVWKKYVGKSHLGLTVGEHDLEYVSEQSNSTREIVQLWADDLVLPDYVRFADAFVKRFGATYRDDISAILVSLGSAGELRYPSYDGHDQNSGYPTRGALQCYSRFAKADFRQAMLRKYHDLNGVNAAWGLHLASDSEIRPPSNADWFFTSGDYRNTPYGRDFIDWYNGCLIDHGRKVLLGILDALGNEFPGAELGYKVPGVHWTMGHPVYPRAAEVAAGLIQTSVDLDSADTGHGYAKIVALAAECSTGRQRKVAMSFTCLEMSDQNWAPQYSQAQTLVGWVGAEAGRRRIGIRGENALGPAATREDGWKNIGYIFDQYPYTSLTILRVDEVAQGIGMTSYRAFIRKYRGFPSLYLRGTNNGWERMPMKRMGRTWTVVAEFGKATNQCFKFDVYGDWSYNFGGTGAGTSGIERQDGQNIAVLSSTRYVITSDEANQTYSATPAVTVPATVEVGAPA